MKLKAASTTLPPAMTSTSSWWRSAAPSAISNPFPLSKPSGRKSKIALFCNVSERNVISAVDIKGFIYEIPYMFHDQKYDDIVLEHFKMDVKPLKMRAWDNFMKSLLNPMKHVRIAVVGKYISLQDSYRSIYEAILHGATANNARLEIVRVDSEDLENKPESTGD